MSRREFVTEEMIAAASSALKERIAHPPPKAQKKYSKKEAVMKLKGEALEALAAGHPLETVVADLNGTGLGLAISSVRQYLKPGRKPSKRKAEQRKNIREKPNQMPEARTETSAVTNKGTFTVIEDDKDI